MDKRIPIVLPAIIGIALGVLTPGLAYASSNVAAKTSTVTVAGTCNWQGYLHRGTASLSVTYSYQASTKTLRLVSWRITDRGATWANQRWTKITNAAFFVTTGPHILAAGRTSNSGTASGTPQRILNAETRRVGMKIQSPAGGVCGVSVSPPASWIL